MRPDSIPWVPHIVDHRGTEVFRGDVVKILRGKNKNKVGELQRFKLEQAYDNYIAVKACAEVYCSRHGYKRDSAWLSGDAFELVRRK